MKDAELKYSPLVDKCDSIVTRYYYIPAIVLFLASLLFAVFYDDEVPDEEGPKSLLAYIMAVILPCSSIILLIKGIVSNK